MRMTGPGKRLCIYLGESDRWQGKPLYLALLETLKREGLAGATVTRAVAGFGAHSRLHVASLERLSTDLPLVVETVDRAEPIARALAVVGPMVREGLITVEDVEVVKYAHRYLQPLPGDRPVRAVMSSAVVAIAPDTPIADIMELLLDRLLKAVPVVDASRRVLGLVTDGDLLARGGAQLRLAIAERLDSEALAAQLAALRASEKQARDVMTAPAVTVKEATSLAHATRLMVARDLKRLPVVDARGCLVGMLSRVDILRTVSETPLVEAHPDIHADAAQTVREVMDPHVPAVALDADLPDIAAQLVTGGWKRVVVVDAAGCAVGIITDGDLVARVSAEARPGVLHALARRIAGIKLPVGQTAGQLMSAGVLTGPPETPIVAAVQQMLAQQRKRFIAVDKQGRPVGIVDRQQLLRAVAGGAPGAEPV